MPSKEIKILVIDDSGVARQMIINSLKSLGYQNIVEARDGSQAITVLEKEIDSDAPVGLVISDLEMPVMPGKDFVSKIRQQDRFKGLPILISSIESNRAAILEVIMRGASSYLIKPITPQALEQKIDLVFKKKAEQ